MRASSIASFCASIGAAMAAVGVNETFRIGAYSVETADVWPTGLLSLSEGSYFLTTQVQGEAAQQKFTWNNATSRLVPVGELSNVQGSVSTEDPSLVFASEISGSEEPLALLQIDTISYIVAPGTTDEDVMQWTSVFDQHARPAAFIFTGPGSPDANSALTLILGE